MYKMAMKTAIPVSTLPEITQMALHIYEPITIFTQGKQIPVHLIII